MKTWIVVGVLLCIVQSIPKKADKPRTDQNDRSSTASESRHPVTVGTQNISLPRPSPEEKQDGSRTQPKEPTWREKLIAAVVANWPVVAVAIWGILVARSTLQAIRWQAQETAAATRAMADNTRAFILSQGPQIDFCQAKAHPNITLAETTPRIEIGIINRGSTTAYDCTYESWIEVLPFPFNDFTSAADHVEVPEKFAMHPNRDKPVTINIPYRKGFTADQRKDIETLKQYACIRVRVSYRDVFSDKPTRYAEFGLYAMLQGFGFLPKYNNSN